MKDIEAHEFEDGDITGACPAMGQMLFINFSDGGHVQLCEADVIAMAQYYGHLGHLNESSGG